MRPARNYRYLTYENNLEGDCVGSSWGHCVHAITGTAPTDADQQKMVRATNDMNGTAPGWYMWKMFTRSLDHFRQRTFGTVGISQAQAEWAIDRYKAFMACVNGGGHEVACIDYDANGIYVVALTIAGAVEFVPWAQFLTMAGRGTFAFTDKFDPLLIGNAIVQNKIWWGAISILAGLFYYILNLTGVL